MDVSKLRDIGWSFWDPVGLLPEGANWRDDACRAFADEYDGYLAAAADCIVKGATDAEVIRYLVNIETTDMGVGSRDDRASRALAVANAIRTESGMPSSALADISGGALLVDWFGRVPRFHDAKLLEISFPGKGMGLLRIHAWDMTNEVDSKGYFILNKHVVVTFALEGVTSVDLVDFEMVPGIVFDLEITRTGANFGIAWSASYGANGSISASRVSLTLVAGKPD